MLSLDSIRRSAREAGFDICGVASCVPLTVEGERFDAWLERGFGLGLDYLYRNRTLRFDPSLMVEGARSVVVCGVSYKNRYSDGYPDSSVPHIGSYALSVDYHRSIKQMLFDLADRLHLSQRGIGFRATVDSAPVAEKSWAVRAGLGSVGRNSLLITPRLGSFVFLGELIVAESVDCYDQPFCRDLCGTCHKCVDSCPNSAIAPDRSVDTRRCIARLTLERSEEVEPRDLHGWQFGCDECQSCCPYNRRAPMFTNPRFEPIIDPARFTTAEWHSMSFDRLDTLTSATALNRAVKFGKQN